MEYAIFEGNEFCSFSLKDINGYYYEEFRKSMRKKSQENAFACPECGENVILNAGPILPPYFSHHKGSNCTMQNNGESREHREGRFLLYLLAKKSFPSSNIRTNYTHENGRRSHVFIENQKELIAINYISSRIIIKDWEEKHDFYSEKGIVDVWILSRNSNLHLDSKNISLISYLTSKVSKTNTIKLLDTINRRITLLHFMPKDYGDSLIESKRIFEQESYNIDDLRLQKDGEFSYRNEALDNHGIFCDLNSKSYQHEYFMDIKDGHNTKDGNDIEDRIDTKDGNDTKYRIDTNDRNDTKDRIDIINRNDTNDSYDTKKNNIIINRNLISSDNKQLESKNKVNEYAVFTSTMKNTFLLKSTNMYWELPVLIGTLEELKIANAKRLDYFIAQDKEIQAIKNFERKEKRIQELKKYLESKIYAKDWINSHNSTKRWR